MQNNKIAKRLMLIVLAIVALFCFFQKSYDVEAAGYYDDDVINDPPPGGLPIKDFFDLGTFNGNSAKISPNSSGLNVVRVTDDANQTGSVWSDNDKNYLNVNKKQTLSMWMYFGSVNSLIGNPDGLAFVLQNGGLDAISNVNGKVNNGESLGVWGSDNNKFTAAKPPRVGNVPTAAEQAIQNSFAVEFDTETNHYKKAATGSLQTPLMYNDYLNDKYNNVPDPHNGMDFLPVSDLNSTFLYEKTDSQYAHIAWNYPARDSTYEQLSNTPPKPGILSPSGTSILAMHHNLGSGKHNGRNVYLQRDSVNLRDSWRHVTIEYTPPVSGTTATLRYLVGDKNANTGASKTPDTDVTVPLDMTAFNLSNGQNKLRYGFTGSTSKDAVTKSAVVFETMPSLVDAEVNTYTVDNTNKSRIMYKNEDGGGDVLTQTNQNNNLIDDDSKGLTPAKTVHPEDDLTLNYMFHYLSGEEPADKLEGSFKIPDNINVKTDSNGNIGKVHYISKSDSSVTKDVDISETSLNDNLVTVAMDNMGDEKNNDWEYARVEINASANKLPDANTSKITVPSTTSTFNSTYFKANVDSASFDIIKPADTIKITTDMSNPTEVKLGDNFDLTGDISFGSGATVNKNDMYINYSIDGGSNIRANDDSSGSKFTIPGLETGTGSGQLNVGDHIIKVQVVDNNYTSPDGTKDTLASNTLDYHIKVTNKSIVITPDNSNITVNDNEPVILSGSYLHSDDTTTSDEGGDSQISYTITNNGTKQDTVTKNQTNNGKYAFTLKPYAYDKDPSTSLDDYTGNTGLKIGKNVVTIHIVDKEGHKSTDKDVIVNVPDISPTLTTDQNEFSVIEDDPINLNGKIGYTGDYQVTPSKLTWNIDANNHKYVKDYGGNTPVVTPIDQDISVDSTANGMTDQDDNPYKVSVYFTDPYGRKSNTVEYDVNIIDKTATIENGDYRFQNVHAIDRPMRVKREGNWNLKVNSVMTKWTLTAKASDMVKDAGMPDETKLDGDLVYVSKDNVTHDLSSQTFIQSDEDDTDSEVTNIAGNWASDQGVLLDLNSRNVSGSYTGNIEWGLSDSI